MKRWQVLLGDWRASDGPLYVQLAAAVRAAVDRADIAPGARLPAERTLAQELGVSRTTVVSAYAKLRDDGWVESRQGSGTSVRRRAAQSGPSAQEREIVGAFRRNTVFRGMIQNLGTTCEFLGAYLDAASEVRAAAEAVVREEAEGLFAGHGYLPLGLSRLRQAIAADFVRRGVPTVEEQILVTNGAQQAIGLMAALFVERGEPVVVEDPTYLGAIDSYTAAGARLVSVPVGSEGVDVVRLREAIGRGARMAYLIPTFHNPTGVVLPEPARRAVARLAEQMQVPIVEDHTLSDLSVGGEPPPPIAAFAPQAPILTIGSLSKLFWGGLRVGWIRGPQALIERLARFKAVADLGSPVLSQAVAARVLPLAPRVKRARKREITRKLDGLTALLREHLPKWTWRRPGGGLLLWVRLPRGNATELAQVALRHGVAIVPGSVNSPDGGFADYVRLPFVQEPEAIEDGVKRLARAWLEYEATTHEPRGHLGVIV